ncbi:MAG: carbamoyltransferase [Desulfamplus sp.]|nr:carbamoyltransferase [Desulfamplus sp.]
MKIILGISAFYHDSAAALVIDGNIIAAAQEERFSRIKHDPSFPSNAVSYLLSEAGIGISNVDVIAFYDKPYIKFERLLESYHAFAPSGLKSFLSSMPVWIKDKLFMRSNIKREIEKVEQSIKFNKFNSNVESNFKFKPKNGLEKKPKFIFPEHHLSHAASAFYPSPFNDAAILTIDGVGEWATTTICHGKDNGITNLRELTFPHSIGLLYSAFTAYCGFKVNSGEYKLMGLAPYGHLDGNDKNSYKKLILENLVDLKSDGSILLNMDYFDYVTGLKMFKTEKWESLFNLPPRPSESEISQSYMDMALALQEITEEIVLRLATTAKRLTGSSNLVMAGGVALNCVANGKLLQSKLFDNIWIQPAAGDAGGALGAALSAYYIWYDSKRVSNTEQYNELEETREDKQIYYLTDNMCGSYLGPKFTSKDAVNLEYSYGAVSQVYDNFSLLCADIAQYIAEDNVVGWFQGRMEWGPRALGNRSIVADPRNPQTQKRLNLKIKYREGFRPFAPSVLAEDVSNYFDIETSSPYMLMVAPVKASLRTKEPEKYSEQPLYERLYHVRSTIPAITHVDYSARIQTVHKETNPKYWELITEFKRLTGIGVVVNTSFNVRGEPIVCTPEDAYRCFMRTEMDILVIENVLFFKKAQPQFNDNELWRDKFELD